MVRTDFGFGQMTRDQLDAVARSGGSLGDAGIDQGIVPVTTDKHRYGYRTVRVGGNGRPDSGVLMVVPTNRHTRDIWRRGKIDMLIAAGMSTTKATRYLEVRGVNNRFEPLVIQGVLEFIQTGLRKDQIELIEVHGRAWRDAMNLRGVSVPTFDRLGETRRETILTMTLAIL